MSVAGERLTVRLTGGGPWGFRLQGGTGTGLPLTVAKIRRKSRSHKNLFENDVIISINDQSCAGLSYDEAMNIVDTAASTLLIKIIRPTKGKENIAPATTESGKTSPIIFNSETAQTKIVNDGHTSETAIRRSENITYQTEHKSYRQSETSPQPSKPFPDIRESPVHHPKPEPRTKSPPLNHYTSPQISPPLPKQPDPSLHKPILPYTQPVDHVFNSISDQMQSHSEIITQKTQKYTQINQEQRQHVMESAQETSQFHSQPLYSQVQRRYESVQQQEMTEQPKLHPQDISQTYTQPHRQIEHIEHVVHYEKPKIHREASPFDKQQTLRQNEFVQHNKSYSDQPGSFMSATKSFSQQQERAYDSYPEAQTNLSIPSRQIWQQTTIESSSSTTPQTMAKHLCVPSVPVQSPIFQPQSADSTLFKVEPLRISESSVTHTWRPGFSSTETQETIRTEFKESQETPHVGMDTKPTDVMKVKGFQTHIYYPPEEEEEMDTSLFTRRRKMYSSSSFYEEAGSIYPTVEEQVELCRKIADSLSADTNKKSRGANMFYKRVKRSHKWIHEGPDRSGSDGGFTSDSDYDSSTPDLSKMEYIKVSKGPPKLKLIMAPKPVQDVVKLRTQAQSVSEHNVLSPDICLGLVRDLNSPCGKGAAMFAKRKQKAEDWVVDEQKVKAQVAQLAAELQQPSKNQDFPWTARLRLVKSPWEAALESPIGSCDAAFSEVTSGGRIDAFADSLMRAAENKIRNQPNGPPPPLLATLTNDLCMPKVPKGWTGATTAESFPSLESSTTSETYDSVAARLAFEPTVTPHNVAFHDFNTRPRSWAPGGVSASRGFRSVQPPRR